MKSQRLLLFIGLLLTIQKQSADSVMHPGDRGSCELCAWRIAIEKSAEPVVYYAAVNDPESRRVRVIRFEAIGGNVVQSYVDSGPARTKNWQEALTHIKGPGSTNVLAEIRTRLTKQKPLDAGKVILFEDRTGTGISAESLGLTVSPMPAVLREVFAKAKAAPIDISKPK